MKAQAPIFVDEEVLDKAAVEVPSPGKVTWQLNKTANLLNSYCFTERMATEVTLR